jgi:hypothetical protein
MQVINNVLGLCSLSWIGECLLFDGHGFFFFFINFFAFCNVLLLCLWPYMELNHS